jgi:hypothetical protein
MVVKPQNLLVIMSDEQAQRLPNTPDTRHAAALQVEAPVMVAERPGSTQSPDAGSGGIV